MHQLERYPIILACVCRQGYWIFIATWFVKILTCVLASYKLGFIIRTADFGILFQKSFLQAILFCVTRNFYQTFT